MRLAIEFTADNPGGLAADLPDINMPNGVWSDSRNVKYRDGACEHAGGCISAMGSLSVTAIWAAPVTDGVTYYWVYTNGDGAYATDGSTHANITSTSFSVAWANVGINGGAFHGFMIANDGFHKPQVWTPDLAGKFTALTNWPAGYYAEVIRPFRDFLVALRISSVASEGGGTDSYNPRLMRWSDAAAQAALPGSWDYSDPTNQSGINEFGQTHDSLVDVLPLRGAMAVYKQFHTWIGDYVGRPDVFTFREAFTQAGMLAEDCGAAFGPRHLVLTDSDVVVHDGTEMQSVIDRRMRRWLFNKLDSNYYFNSFVVADYRSREIWVCFPESGHTWPNLALVWSMVDGSLDVRDLGGGMTFGSVGVVPGGSDITFAAFTDTIESWSDPFDNQNFNPSAFRLLMTRSDAKKIEQMNSGVTFDGTTQSCYAERTGITISQDMNRLKRVTRIFPKIIGTDGDTFNFYVSTRSTVGGSSSQHGPYPFVIGSDYKIDLGAGRGVSARVLDVRVEYAGTNTFRFFGFDVDWVPDGTR